MLEMLANGVVNILTPEVLVCLLGGVTVGIILGAIPGLSATMAIIGSASGENVFKGLAAGALGLLLGTVGFDPMEGSSRLTFGVVKLASGIDLVVMLIGLLALSAIMIQVENLAPSNKQTSVLPPPKGPEDERLSRKEVKRLIPIWFQSALIGSGIGALPGLGTTLAAWLGYDTAKRRSKHPEKFGTGIIEGVAGPEAANNAVCGSNMIPLLTMGIPGDVTAALLVGAFMLQGLTPGPMIFREDPQSVYNIYVGILASNLVMFAMTFLLLRVFKQVSKLPPNIITPCVCMFCMVGVYALYTSLEDILIMLVFTVAGYILMKFGYPVACMLVGFILSPMLEKYARMALTMSDGSFDIFFSSPLDWVLWAVVVFSIVTIIRSRIKSARKEKAEYLASQAAAETEEKLSE